MKTLALAVRWMFTIIVPTPADNQLTNIVKGKEVNLKLTHEAFGCIPVVSGQFGKADVRISLNPPIAFKGKEIIILVNPAEGEFTSIKVELSEAALMQALVDLIQSDKV